MPETREAEVRETEFDLGREAALFEDAEDVDSEEGDPSMAMGDEPALERLKALETLLEDAVREMPGLVPGVSAAEEDECCN